MSLAALWTFLAVALPLVTSFLAPMSTVDLAYQLRAGAEIVDARAIPVVDTWTFIASGQPWLDQQWGAQVLLHAVYAIGGWVGLALLRAVLIGVVFGGLFAVVQRVGLVARIAAVLTLAAFVVAVPALALRPQLFGMVCFVAVAWLLSVRRTTPRALWLAPVVVLLWANLHGSFFLGPVLIGLAWLQDLHDRDPGARRTLLALIASAVATCLTPFGPAVWVYAAGLTADPEVTSRVSEWQPTSIHDVAGVLFFASALAVVAIVARRGRVVPWPSLAGLAIFFVIGLWAQRGIAWWALGAAPIVATLMPLGGAASARTETRTMRRLNVVVAGMIVVAAIVVMPIWRPVEPGTGAPAGLLTAAPPGITASLRAVTTPGDHVFQPQPWGSWFEFSVPLALYGVDSRIELFTTEMWAGYDRVVAGIDGWQSQLDAWSVTTVVVDADDTDFAARLAAAGWTARHMDADGWVFQR